MAASSSVGPRGDRGERSPSQLARVVYTPEPLGRTPAALLREMWRDLLASRELAWRLFVRDVTAQYRQSLLGVTWAFLPPILTGLIFIALQARSVITFQETAVPYPVFVLVGTIYWQIFVDAVQAPLKTVTTAKPILVRVNFPREALILSSAYVVLLSALIKGVVLVGVLVYFDVPVAPGIALAPAALGIMIMLGLTVGVLLTPAGLLYTDVSSGLGILLQLWFFATPVVYPPPQSHPLSLLATLNPVSPLLGAARDLTTTGTLSDPIGFLAVSGLTLAGVAAAWGLYRIALPIINERLGA